MGQDGKWRLHKIGGREESPFCFDHYGEARHHDPQLGRTVFFS